jgi:hypothetical protein
MRDARKPAPEARHCCLSGVAVALAIFLAAGTAMAQDGFISGGWKGGPELNEETGAFARCAMRLEYGGGETLRLLLSPDGDLGVAVANAGRWLADGAERPVGISLDDTDIGMHAARISDGEYLSVRVPFAVSSIDRLGLANQLNISLLDRVLNFPLTGIGRAMPLLLQCLGQALAPRMGPYGPFAAPGEGGDGTASDGGASSEGEATVMALLADAGLTDFTLVPTGSKPPGALYAWSDGKTVGALFAVAAGSVSLDLLTTLVLGDIAAHCQGELVHGSRAATLAGEIPARYTVASCWGAAGSHFLVGSAWRTPETTALIIHRGSSARDTVAADRKLLEIFAARLR